MNGIFSCLLYAFYSTWKRPSNHHSESSSLPWRPHNFGYKSHFFSPSTKMNEATNLQRYNSHFENSYLLFMNLLSLITSLQSLWCREIPFWNRRWSTCLTFIFQFKTQQQGHRNRNHTHTHTYSDLTYWNRVVFLTVTAPETVRRCSSCAVSAPGLTHHSRCLRVNKLKLCQVTPESVFAEISILIFADFVNLVTGNLFQRTRKRK